MGSKHTAISYIDFATYLLTIICTICTYHCALCFLPYDMEEIIFYFHIRTCKQVNTSKSMSDCCFIKVQPTD